MAGPRRRPEGESTHAAPVLYVLAGAWVGAVFGAYLLLTLRDAWPKLVALLSR